MDHVDHVAILLEGSKQCFRSICLDDMLVGRVNERGSRFNLLLGLQEVDWRAPSKIVLSDLDLVCEKD